MKVVGNTVVKPPVPSKEWMAKFNNEALATSTRRDWARRWW